MRSKEGKGGVVSEERKSRLGGEWLFLLVFVAGGCLWGERFDRLREKKKNQRVGAAVWVKKNAQGWGGGCDWDF